MLHQPRHPASQCRPRILCDDILERLSEINGPLLGRPFLRKVIPVPDDLRPVVAVEVVHRAAGPDDQGVGLSEWTKGRAELDVEVRVEPCVVGDDDVREGFAAGEHPFQDHAINGSQPKGERFPKGSHIQCIVDLLKLGLECRIKPGVCQQPNDLARELQIRIQVEIDVSRRIDPGDGLFRRGGIGRNENLFAHGLPVGAHHDDALDTLVERLTADLFPVSGCRGAILKHGSGAVAEEEDGECGRHDDGSDDDDTDEYEYMVIRS